MELLCECIHCVGRLCTKSKQTALLCATSAFSVSLWLLFLSIS